MGKIDAASKTFFSESQNFADLFNIGLLHKDMIKPSSLIQLNPDLTTPILSRDKRKIRNSLEHILDELKRATVMNDGRATYVVLGVQSQARLHLAMAVRDMMAAAQIYDAEVRAVSRTNRGRAAVLREKRARGDKLSFREKSFLAMMTDSTSLMSGLLPSDRLQPVVILVVYLGQKPWNGPVHLLDMIEPTDKTIMQYVGDFWCNIVTPEDIERSAPEGSDSQLVLAMTLISKGRKGKRELLSLQNDPRYERVHPEVITLVNTLLNTNFALRKGEGEYMSMCKAMREINDEMAMMNSRIENSKKEIVRSKKELARKDNQIARKDSQIARKDNQLAKKDKKIRQLQREIVRLKKRETV